MRYGIVDLNTMEVVADYRAQRSCQESYGGPWGDRGLFCHVIIAPALDAVPVSGLMGAQLEDAPLIDECGCPLFDRIVDEEKLAFDSDGQPILGPDGQQVRSVNYVQIPRRGPIFRIVQR